MHRILALLLSCLKGISVEPPTILAGVGVNMYAIASDLGMYRVFCDKLFNAGNGTALNDHQSFECWDTSRALGDGINESWWHEAEIQIQQQTTSWSMASSIVSMVPAMISCVIAGAFGDRRGRKPVMLAGMFGIILYMVPSTFIFSFPRTAPIYITFIGGFLASCTGFYSSFMAGCAAYLTDTVTEKEMLTIRMSILQICTTMGVVLGPLIGNALLNVLDYTWAVVVGMGISCAAFVWIVFVIKHIRPKAACQMEFEQQEPNSIKVFDIDVEHLEKEIETMAAEEKNKENELLDSVLVITAAEENGTKPPTFVTGKQLDSKLVDQLSSLTAAGKTSTCQDIIAVIKEVPHLVIDSFRTLFRPRPDHQRAYILISAFVLFLFCLVDTTFNGTVFVLFIQKEPLSWTQDEVSYFRSIANLVRLIGTAVGIFVLKKFLRMSDTFIIILAFLSMIAQGVLITLSTSTWMLYAAACSGALASLSYPCAQAFSAKMMNADEVGKAYGAFSLFTTLSYLLSSVAMGAVYHSTVAYFPSLVFLICTIMLIVGMMFAVWVHLDVNRGAIGRCVKKICACCGGRDEFQVQ